MYTKNNIKNNTPMYTKNNILDVLVGFSFQSLPSYFDSEKVHLVCNKFFPPY